MDKFIYLHSLDDIKNGLSERQDYHLYHLVDDINLRYVSLQGDFVTFINDEDEKQMFSLSHMYTKKAIRPDDDLFRAHYIGVHDNAVKHDVSKTITSYEDWEKTLKAYGFDGFYMLISVDDLVNNLQAGYFYANSYKKNPTIKMDEIFVKKTQQHDGLINFKDNINHFVRLHYRPKDDMLVAFYQSFKRLNKDKVLVRLTFDFIKNEHYHIYPLANCGLDLIYDAAFYQLNLKRDNVTLHHFEKFDYVAQFSSYDNHRHSTMTRTAEVLVYDKLPTHFIDQLIFENEEEKSRFLDKLSKEKREKIQHHSSVDQSLFI